MKIKVLCSILFSLIIFLAPVSALSQGSPSAQKKQTVYNHITSEGSSLDELTHKIYDGEFNVVDIRKEDGSLQARVSEGALPKNAVSKDGRKLEGYVLILYLITDEGRTTKPRVVKTTDKQLDEIALKATETWQFHPPTLKGKSVWSTAAQEFSFKK